MTDSIHKTLASGRWKEFSFAKQMANIDSEVSRAVKWKYKGNKEYMENAVERCLELIDHTVLSRQEHMKISEERKSCALTELMRVREVICDYFFC